MKLKNKNFEECEYYDLFYHTLVIEVLTSPCQRRQLLAELLLSICHAMAMIKRIPQMNGLA